MGPTPTLLPHPQPPPTSHYQRTRRPGSNVDHDLVLDVDQPSVTTTRPEHAGDLALAEAALRAHRELAEVDSTRPAEEPEPLGRRLPEALEASRQGVER